VQVDILTLHPQLCAGPLDHSIIGRARARGEVRVGVHDIRDHGLGRHRTVDDSPYGGGSGMVMRVDVLDAAIAALRGPDTHVALMDPAGARFRQADAVRLAGLSHLVLVCGHYEGVDGRVAAHLVDEVLSIGDFVLTVGELAALVIADAVLRLRPGAELGVQRQDVDLHPQSTSPSATTMRTPGTTSTSSRRSAGMKRSPSGPPRQIQTSTSP
jgi:tRNA (guanine37-N1)-methyltransferase